MKIKASIKEIEITIGDGARFVMTWDELKQLERAFTVIRELQKACSFDRIEIETM